MNSSEVMLAHRQSDAMCGATTAGALPVRGQIPGTNLQPHRRGLVRTAELGAVGGCAPAPAAGESNQLVTRDLFSHLVGSVTMPVSQV